MRKRNGCALVLLCVFTLGWRVAAQQAPAWGSGIAPFAFALIGDMPYGEPREAQFARLGEGLNRDNDLDFVMHAGDIKAGSERCDDELIKHRFSLYEAFQRIRLHTRGQRMDRLSPSEQRRLLPARAPQLRAFGVFPERRRNDRRPAPSR